MSIKNECFIPIEQLKPIMQRKYGLDVENTWINELCRIFLLAEIKQGEGRYIFDADVEVCRRLAVLKGYNGIYVIFHTVARTEPFRWTIILVRTLKKGQYPEIFNSSVYYRRSFRRDFLYCIFIPRCIYPAWHCLLYVTGLYLSPAKL